MYSLEMYLPLRLIYKPLRSSEPELASVLFHVLRYWYCPPNIVLRLYLSYKSCLIWWNDMICGSIVSNLLAVIEVKRLESWFKTDMSIIKAFPSFAITAIPMRVSLVWRTQLNVFSERRVSGCLNENLLLLFWIPQIQINWSVRKIRYPSSAQPNSLNILNHLTLKRHSVLV